MSIHVDLPPFVVGGAFIVGALAFLFVYLQLNRIETVLGAVASKILGEEVP